MIRVVFDTNVLYSAIYKPGGAPAKAVDLIVSGLILPCVSDAVLDEYRAVLLRPELDLHATRRQQVLAVISSLSLRITPSDVLKISADEDDNRFYECAAEALADYIVTGNAKHFPKAYKNTRIITARALVDLFAS